MATFSRFTALRKKNDIIEIFNRYKGFFDIIKYRLINEERSQEFIQNFIDYYQINDDNLIDKLTILFKSKKYEFDIKSIIFFFEYFQKYNEKWNELFKKNLKSWNNFKEIKSNLNLLKENKIYDYNNIGNYNKLFTCLYDKKVAFDFLFLKTSNEILKLKDKILPNDIP